METPKTFFLALGITIATLFRVTNVSASETTSFVVIGDMPYLDEENAMMTAPDGKIYKAIRELDPPVLIHLGDLKDGGSGCTDELLKSRQEQIAQLNPNRIIFTPGDNDWTDCDREGMSPRYDELERLDFIRELFYSGEGAEMYSGIQGLERQEGVIENVVWRINDLQFGVLNVPGTNNGREEILLTDPVSKALDVADERDSTNAAWLDHLFEKAKDMSALVIAFQEDIYRNEENIEYAGIECTETVREKCDGLKKVRDQIEKLAKEYGKPVLVIHGSTNAYCFHQPAEGVSNLWRLNAPGDFKYSDIAQVTFNPEDHTTPFTVIGVIENREMPTVCDYSRE